MIHYTFEPGYAPYMGESTLAPGALVPEIGLDSMSLPTLLRPISNGQGSFAWWVFKPQGLAPDHAHSIPYGSEGHVANEAPGYFSVLFDPTLSRYATEHESVDHAHIQVSYTETVRTLSGALVGSFNRLYSATDAPLEVTFWHGTGTNYQGEGVTYEYSDVTVRIQCYRLETQYAPKTYGPHYAVLRTSAPSKLTPWIQMPVNTTVITAVGPAPDATYESSHFDSDYVDSSGYLGFRKNGHRGDHEYYRSFHGEEPSDNDLAAKFSWQTALSGMGPGGVHYWNHLGAVEWTGPPASRLAAPYDATAGWGGYTCGYSYGWNKGSTMISGTAEVNVYGVGFGLPLLDLEDTILRQGADGRSAAAWSTELRGLHGGTAATIGVHWEEARCTLTAVQIAPDHSVGSAMSDQPTRWAYTPLIPVVAEGSLEEAEPLAPNYGPWAHLESSTWDDGSHWQWYFTQHFAQGDLGDLPAWADGANFLWDYDGGAVGWTDINWQESYNYLKDLHSQDFNPLSGELELRNGEESAMYLHGFPAQAQTNRAGPPAGVQVVGSESSNYDTQFNDGQGLSFRVTALPARYRVHMKPTLSAADPMYPEQSIDINFKLSRRRFSGR